MFFDENNVLLSPSFLNDEKILKLHCYHLWYNGLMFRFQLHGHKNIQRIYIHWLWKGILLHKVNALYKKNYNLIIMQLSSCVLISLIRQVSRRFWQKMSFDCKINLVSAISRFFHTHHTFEVKVMKFISYTNNIKVYLVKRHQHNFILW